ncbi:MAG: FAD-dependent oxidoreductase [Deltaproteobacteria bacterium]|nr:MAG: FAD-dependent oxidoreductase [Deltaproteobacteria bacterium]
MGEIYHKLFEPVRIGRVVLKNRIAMAPMGLVGLTDREGNPLSRAIDYYVERARGGVGLIITGLFKVENKIDAAKEYMNLISHTSLGPLGELGEAVHSLGTKIFIQLTAGFGRVSRSDKFFGQPVSASALPNYWNPTITCRPLTTEEVETIVEAFGDASETVVTAGMDGIELHGHEGYLFDQFTTPIWNRRTDKYGGELRDRLRFPMEVLREIKKRLGNGFPVMYRFGLKHYIKGQHAGALKGEQYVEAGRDVEEGLEMAKLLEEAGFDALHVDAGCYDSWYWAHPPLYQEHGCMVDMAAMVKNVVKIPVVAVGRLEVPELAEKIIEKKKADIVALGRGLLADPYWPIQVQEGRIEDIRPCIGCHDGCFGRFSLYRPLCCTVNPAVGRERLYRLISAEKRRRVLVVGGGVAGMEAARVAAIRGHSVTLYEKEKNLGGHLNEASVPDFKKDLRSLLHWYEVQLKKLRVEVRLETEASVTLINKDKTDVVLIATGSEPIIPDLQGIEQPNVVTCVDLLRGKSKAGDTAVVLGGGLIGCETALWLAQQGRNISVVEKLPELMAGSLPVPRMNRIMLLDLLAVNGVNIVTDASVQEITNEKVRIERKDLGEMVIKADTVVLAGGMKSNDTLYNALIGKVVHLYALGDCREPRNITGAVWDGYEVGRTV